MVKKTPSRKSGSYTRGIQSEDTHVKITEDNYADLGFSEDHIGALVRKPEARGQGGPMHDESAAGRGGKLGQTQAPSSVKLLEKQYARANTLLEKENPNYRSKEFAERRAKERGGSVEDWMKNPVPSEQDNEEVAGQKEGKQSMFTATQELKDKYPDDKFIQDRPTSGQQKLLKQYTRAAEILKADFDVNHKNTSVTGTSSGKDALNTKESFTTIHNYEARKREHDQLLREYGFPSEQDPEANRYGRFVEVETDEKGVVMHNKPPWIVAENSELVAEINDEDSPTYHKSPKAKNREGKDTISIKKDLEESYQQNLSKPKNSVAAKPISDDTVKKPKQGFMGRVKDTMGQAAIKTPWGQAGKYAADKGKDVASKATDVAKKTPWGQLASHVNRTLLGQGQGQDGTYRMVDGVPTNTKTGKPFSQKAMLIKASYDRAEQILKSKKA